MILVASIVAVYQCTPQSLATSVSVCSVIARSLLKIVKSKHIKKNPKAVSVKQVC